MRFRRCTHWKINALRFLPAILTVIPIVILTKNLTYSYYYSRSVSLLDSYQDSRSYPYYIFNNLTYSYQDSRSNSY